MKNIVLFALMLFVSLSFAQESQDKTVSYDKNAKLTHVVYYHDNGNVSQEGYFNSQGNLQNQWISYDVEGNKTAVAYYDNGKKVGKWFFWDNDVLREVEFENNVAVEFSEWTKRNNVAIRD